MKTTEICYLIIDKSIMEYIARMYRYFLALGSCQNKQPSLIEKI